MFYHKMKKEQKRIENKLKTIEFELKKLPEGTLICSQNNTRYKWYNSNGKSKTYIPKANRKLAEQLALRKYLNLERKELLEEKQAIDYYLKHSPSRKKESSELYCSADYLVSTNPEFKNLLHSQIIIKDEQLRAWQNEDYSRNPKYPEQLIHKTISGNMVRSKSEAMIDMLLYKNSIPFRYECALQLGPHTFYPDFTIRHPVTGEFYYWEHFGMMDDPTYYKNVYPKLYTYTSFGIIPNIQLVTTYETSDNPLSSEEIENILSRYFM